MVHPSDVAPMLMALDASVTVRGPKGTRRVAVENLYVHPSEDPRRETILEGNEIITDVAIPHLLRDTTAPIGRLGRDGRGILRSPESLYLCGLKGLASSRPGWS